MYEIKTVITDQTEPFSISLWLSKQKRFPRKVKKFRKKIFGDRWQYRCENINHVKRFNRLTNVSSYDPKVLMYFEKRRKE